MMLGKLESTLSTLRSQIEPSEEPDSHLFSCVSCQTVYIATEKQSCPQCGGAVKRVPATLAETEEL